MSDLEARAVITAVDQTGAAFASVQDKIRSLESSVGSIAKAIDTVDQVAKSVAPTSAAIGAAADNVQRVTEATRGLLEQRAALVRDLNQVPLNDAAVGAQEKLRAKVAEVNAAIGEQGVAAARSSEQLVAAVEREDAAQRRRAEIWRQFNNVLPMLGPPILRAIYGEAEAGATVQEHIAQLQTSGAAPEEIDKARSDFREFARDHAGVLEAEYLTSYKDARVIAPAEAFEMAQLGARYRAALRNSGMSASESDVGNVMRIMDELGLPDMAQREGFLNDFLKSQQAFGEQIQTGTALSAYRNAKQSIYDWSPEFRQKYFPTLLQSSGQMGGTEMMTALNNYIGQHMQQSELRALAAAGFVNSSDLIENKVGDVNRLKPGAHLFEADVFKTNIAQWAWDFHKEFMGREGATEGAFGELIAKMPRNMAALIAFMTHNEARIRRDAETLNKPVGLAAADNASLANNPVAGLTALKDAIEQFGAAVSSPGMKAAGSALQSLAQWIQNLATGYGGFAKNNPNIASWLGNAEMAAGGGLGFYLSARLLTGLGSILFGGGAMTASATALGGSAAALTAAAAALDGSAVKLGAGGAGGLASNIAPAAASSAGWWGSVMGGLGYMGGAMAMIAQLPTLTTPEEDEILRKAMEREEAGLAQKRAEGERAAPPAAVRFDPGHRPHTQSAAPPTPPPPAAPPPASTADWWVSIAAAFRKSAMAPAAPASLAGVAQRRAELEGYRQGSPVPAGEDAGPRPPEAGGAAASTAESRREARRAEALGALPMREAKAQLDPDSKANVNVDVTVHVEDGAIVKALASATATATASGNISANVGVSTAGVSPNGRRGPL